ncbi:MULTISPECIES: hypothetical protein [unclassified Tenacibaculum]|uniref:hypothetical protein n=1 Tax=unclassified Tenacibaculum TaxID=2635139 RepID=UPI001F3BDA01|nr:MULTISPECIES: hypothetical protein [unclassified Tenacibaculum]MCF2875194.1 hypothetical protein [Tenacibaculum sp. Cn5-1]MCF2935270.1 hypothetical protein [Tenacibaculum sp. Cn5-34]MCG7511288.1 hypothetical protein [Tenacibaculum sp. Cn5-46]
MINSIFHNKEFELYGISVPEFELKKGKLIRLYIPSTRIIGFDLTIELIKHFQNKNENLPWTKNYSQNSILEKLFPLTVEMYLIKKKKIDKQNAIRIVEEIGIKLNDKFEEIGFINRKALIIKALFEKNNSILIDYYGADAIGIKKLEQIVNTEIEKGKTGIAFDLLEYIEEKEPYENIERIKITK